MKILSSLLQKIKAPSFIGFISACGLYLAGGLYFADIFQQKPISIQQNGEHTMTLKLSSIDSSGNQKVLSTTPPPKPISKPKPKPIPKPKTPTKPLSQEKPQQKEHSAEQQPKIKQPTQASNITQKGGESETLAYNQGISNEFLSQIHTAISNYNSYPRIARLKKLEGRVELEFILDINGEMSGLKIIQSNHQILGKSAFKAVQNASKDFPIPKQKVRIRVPVIYNLKNH